MRRAPSQATPTTASWPRPSSAAALARLKWLASETKIRSREAAAGRPCVCTLPWPYSRAHQASRMSSTAMRFDCVPPLVNTPSAASGRPARAAVQAMSFCSMKVAPALWSQVSSDELIALSTTSAATDGTSTGQFRCAA